MTNFRTFEIYRQNAVTAAWTYNYSCPIARSLRRAIYRDGRLAHIA